MLPRDLGFTCCLGLGSVFFVPQSWAEDGEPKVMWLAGLHAPETYLAALVQMACRDRGWPLDRSTLYTQVTPYTDAAQVQQKPRCAAHCALTVVAWRVRLMG